MLDIVQSFPLLSYCIVGPMSVYIYISPICNVETSLLFCENNKIRDSLFSLFTLSINPILIQTALILINNLSLTQTTNPNFTLIATNKNSMFLCIS